MSLSRRNFLQKSAMTTGLATISTLGMAHSSEAGELEEEKLPREVWIACFSQTRLYADTAELMVEKVLEALKKLESYHPDFVCLPELFACTHVRKTYTNKEILTISEWTLGQFSAYSRKNNCYTICPVYTSDSDGNIYNSAVLINRQGAQIGTYRKIHITEGEISEGITPGPLFQPVIQTDFGKIGIQICYDINWDDGWNMLKKQGAEIVFWPSAYGGGRMINDKAWQYKYVVASSTQKNDSNICDISGEELARTGFWSPRLCYSPVNLEKTFLHIWPNSNVFHEIRKKYGRKVMFTLFQEEGLVTIESRSPNVFVNDILKEFNLKKQEDEIENAEIAQNKARR